jgi:hypothetical protein
MARPPRQGRAALRREPGAVQSEIGDAATIGSETASGSAGSKSGLAGAQVHPKYHDRHEEYVLVTRDDLREVRELSWFQQGLFGVGAFFFSGAFWLLIELLAHQQKYEFDAWVGMCLLSMAFGAIVGGVGLRLFFMRQQRLDKYFPKDGGE